MCIRDRLNIAVMFALGSITGLLILSKILSYLILNFNKTINQIIIGFVTGSLFIVWPWNYSNQNFEFNVQNLDNFLWMFFGLFIVLFFSCQNNDSKIFNGFNLDGWVNYGGGKFYVENECIVAEAVMGLPNTFLHTEKKYQNFELEFDVKLDTVLNSGVQIRSNIYREDTETIRWGGRFDEEGEKSLKYIRRKAGVFWGYQIF